MLVNKFNIILDFYNLDSDLLDIKNHYNKNVGGCFWVVERNDYSQINRTVCNKKSKIIGLDKYKELPLINFQYIFYGINKIFFRLLPNLTFSIRFIHY